MVKGAKQQRNSYSKLCGSCSYYFFSSVSIGYTHDSSKGMKSTPNRQWTEWPKDSRDRLQIIGTKWLKDSRDRLQIIGTKWPKDSRDRLRIIGTEWPKDSRDRLRIVGKGA